MNRPYSFESSDRTAGEASRHSRKRVTERISLPLRVTTGLGGCPGSIVARRARPLPGEDTTSPAIMFREKRDVFEMQNLRRAVLRSMRDLHHIEPKGARRLLELRLVRVDGTSQNFLLSAVHRKIARDESACCARLHLNEHQRITVATDQIDFPPPVTRVPPVSRHQHEAMRALQPIGGVLFSARAGIIGHLERQKALQPAKHVRTERA